MECFLQARAQELLTGGLIALIFSGRRNGTLHSQTAQSLTSSLLESCLLDMVRTVKNISYPKFLMYFHSPIVKCFTETVVPIFECLIHHKILGNTKCFQLVIENNI